MTPYAIDSADMLRIEEERRLFYVAATRPKDSLTLTTAAARLGTPPPPEASFRGVANRLATPG